MRFTRDPHALLAAAILAQAARDWKMLQYNPGERKELIDFFNSYWGNLLCDLLDIDIAVVREKLFVPDLGRFVW